MNFPPGADVPAGYYSNVLSSLTSANSYLETLSTSLPVSISIQTAELSTVLTDQISEQIAALQTALANLATTVDSSIHSQTLTMDLTNTKVLNAVIAQTTAVNSVNTSVQAQTSALMTAIDNIGILIQAQTTALSAVINSVHDAVDNCTVAVNTVNSSIRAQTDIFANSVNGSAPFWVNRNSVRGMRFVPGTSGAAAGEFAQQTPSQVTYVPSVMSFRSTDGVDQTGLGYYKMRGHFGYIADLPIGSSITVRKNIGMLMPVIGSHNRNAASSMYSNTQLGRDDIYTTNPLYANHEDRKSVLVTEVPFVNIDETNATSDFVNVRLPEINQADLDVCLEEPPIESTVTSTIRNMLRDFLDSNRPSIRPPD